jgi:hypothetical protein
MSNREYQYYSEAELLELKRDLERLRTQAERERDAYTRQWSPIPDSVWTSEDYMMFSQRISNHENALSAIRNEFAERRRERETETG